MKVTLYYGGCANRFDRKEANLERLIDRRTIELQRVPNKGEDITLFIDRFWIDATVSHVFTNYTESGNTRYREESWGDSYAIQLSNIEIIEEYE